MLPQVLVDGRMTDGQGRTMDFKNTVIVMTSNLGSQMIKSMAGDDYQVIKLDQPFRLDAGVIANPGSHCFRV